MMLKNILSFLQNRVLVSKWFNSRFGAAAAVNLTGVDDTVQEPIVNVEVMYITYSYLASVV